MRTRPIFLILMMITLSLAGCLDGTDVSGSLQTGGDQDEGGVSWNNQTTYVNETTIIQQTVYMPEKEIFIKSGYGGSCQTWENSSDGSSTCISSVQAQAYEITMFSIPANMTAEILGGNNAANGANYLYMNVQCNSGWTMTQALMGAQYTNMHVPSDGSGCDVKNSQAFSGYWSVTYVLHNATVL